MTNQPPGSNRLLLFALTKVWDGRESYTLKPNREHRFPSGCPKPSWPLPAEKTHLPRVPLTCGLTLASSSHLWLQAQREPRRMIYCPRRKQANGVPHSGWPLKDLWLQRGSYSKTINQIKRSGILSDWNKSQQEGPSIFKLGPGPRCRLAPSGTSSKRRPRGSFPSLKFTIQFRGSFPHSCDWYDPSQHFRGFSHPSISRSSKWFHSSICQQDICSNTLHPGRYSEDEQVFICSFQNTGCFIQDEGGADPEPSTGYGTMNKPTWFYSCEIHLPGRAKILK